MVTYAKIIKAINSKLNTQFPSIERQATDEDEGIIRPSFRTTIDSIKTSNFMNVAKDREMTIRIYYFPTNKEKYRIEILDIQDQLEALFIGNNTITTEDGFMIQVWESEFDLIDGVLHFYVDIQISEAFERTDTTPLMEELNFEENID